MFSLISAWRNAGVSNRDAGDMRRHHAHYDITVMWYPSDARSQGIISHVIDMVLLKLSGFSTRWVTLQFKTESKVHTVKYLYYKTHLGGQLNCWSLRCSWSIACRRCSNYIFILNLIHGFNRMDKDNCKTGRETLKFWDLVHLIFEIWRYQEIHASYMICCALLWSNAESNLPIPSGTVTGTGGNHTDAQWNTPEVYG